MEKFLVIDDSSTIQKVVQLAFAPYAVEIINANSYIEAINVSSQETPSLVIADASLPGIKGAEDYANLRQRLGNIPFVILIGSYDGVDQASFHQLGFGTFLAKPFEATDLVSTVWQSIGREIPAKSISPGGAPPPPPAFAGESTNSRISVPPPPPPMGNSVAGEGPQFTNTFPNTAPRTTVPPISAISEIDISDVPYEESTATRPLPTTPAPDPVDSQSDHSPPIPPQDLEPEESQFGEQATEESSVGSFQLDPEPEDTGHHVQESAEELDANRYEAAEMAHEEYDEDQVNGSDHAPEPMHYDSNDDHEVEAPSFSGIDNEGSFTPPPPPPEEASDHPLVSPDSSEGEYSEGPYIENVESSHLSHGDAERVQGLLEPFLRDEMAKIVEKTVLAYCERNFPKIAREIVTNEIEKLTSEKSRLLIDN